MPEYAFRLEPLSPHLVSNLVSLPATSPGAWDVGRPDSGISGWNFALKQLFKPKTKSTVADGEIIEKIIFIDHQILILKVDLGKRKPDKMKMEKERQVYLLKP